MKHIPAAMIFVGLMLLAVVAFGQDHHPLHRDFYMHWKQPGTNIGCCQARINHGWGETGDCEPAESKVVKGQWFARLPPQHRSHGDKDGFIPVPDAKIIREKNPNIFDGHLCWTPHQGVLCFVPPNVGG